MFVAVVASLVTIVVAFLFPGEIAWIEKDIEGFSADTPQLPQLFTPEEQAKLKLLRDKTLFVSDANGVRVNMPVWVERELRVTNASPTDGAVRLQRTDGTSAALSVATNPVADSGTFPAYNQGYYMLSDARDLLIKNGDGTTHRVQPYTIGYAPDSPNAYLAAYPTDPQTGKTHDTQYTNRQDAYRECTRIVSTGGVCGGITKNTENGVYYTLRVGAGGLKQSPYGEISTPRA